MNYLKSPLNYTGGKHKLLEQILPLLPKKIDTFVDLFAGGCNVAVNISAKKIIANDIEQNIIALYQYLQNNDADVIMQEIEQIIQKFHLSESLKYGYEKYATDSSRGVGTYNKEAYAKLRNAYNNKPTPLMFYTTLAFAFNNQIRFNAKGEFNTPVNKRDFNKNMQKNLKLFIERIQSIDISFTSLHFSELVIPENSFIYIDPPYLATIAAYNENGGWNEEKERELLSYMDMLHSKNIRFALSNVFENKGNTNELLLDWSKSYSVHHLAHTYHNCNYQAKNKKNDTTKEILITNY